MLRLQSSGSSGIGFLGVGVYAALLRDLLRLLTSQSPSTRPRLYFTNHAVEDSPALLTRIQGRHFGGKSLFWSELRLPYFAGRGRLAGGGL